MRKIVFAAVAALIITVQSAQSASLLPPFPEQEYAALKKVGTGQVSGQAFLRTRGGDVKIAAGEAVMLQPVTSYSTVMHDMISADRDFGDFDQRVIPFIQNHQADAQGRFRFANVPSGEYFLLTTIKWETATGYNGRSETQGGFVIKRITVRDGEAIDVMLTR